MTSRIFASNSVNRKFVVAAICGCLVFASRQLNAQDQSPAADQVDTTLVAGPAQAKPEKPNSSSLDELLARAMEHHPDIIAAKAKIATAEAELNSKRMEIAREITSLANGIKEQERLIEVCKVHLLSEQEALKKAPGSISDAELEQTRTNLVMVMAKLDRSKADLRVLVGDDSTHTKPNPLNSVIASPMPRGPAVERIKAALDKDVDLEYSVTPTPINQVMEYIQDRYKVPIYIHFNAADGLDASTILISFDMKDTQLRYALEAIEDHFDGGIKFVVRDYGLLLTGKRDAEINNFVPAVTFGLEPEAEKSGSKTAASKEPPLAGRSRSPGEQSVEVAKENRKTPPTFVAPPGTDNPFSAPDNSKPSPKPAVPQSDGNPFGK